MPLQIHSKDLTITSNIKTHLESAAESFRKYSLDITSIKADIKKEKQGVSVEFNIHIAHNDPVIITQSDNDLDVAIDLAIDRTTKALRRLHDKIVSHRNTPLKDIPAQEV